MRQTFFRWGGAVIVGLLLLAPTGCAVGRSHDDFWSDTRFTLGWPNPPEIPRIRYLRSIGDQAGSDEGERTPGRLRRWLTGEQSHRLPLLSPYGVAADGDGRIWVTDPGAGLVHVFDLATNRVDYLTGSHERPLSSPVGVAVDRETGRVYVADSALAAVLVFDYKGRDLGALQPPGGFRRPGGLACDADGTLYAVDVLNGTVETFARDGTHRRTLGSAVARDSRFNRPSNVFVDRQGRIFVSDAMNFRVEILDAAGASLGTIGALGDVPGTFSRPRGVAVDSGGHVYVADAAFDNIQIFTTDGRLLLYFGGAGKDPGEFNLPAGLFFDQNDRLYVVDGYNRRVQIFQYLPIARE